VVSEESAFASLNIAQSPSDRWLDTRSAL